MFSKSELKRYNRHIILPEIGLEGQDKLKSAKVLVVGAGGLGCPALQYIAAAGVGTIGVCDFDFVDESNLQRQILFDTNDIGKSKAKIAAEKLSKQNQFVKINTHNVKLDKENVLEIFSDYDIIVDGSDNFPTRFLVSDACVILGKPLVFGAIYKFEGQLSVFNYKNGPTYRCLVPEEPESSEILSCSQIGVIGVLPGIIGSYQANEVIKIITGIGEIMSGKILLLDTLNMTHNIIEIKRKENLANLSNLGEYGDFCGNNYSNVKQITSAELKQMLDNKKDVLIVDIRESEAFNQYHIKSVNISIDKLLNNADNLPIDKPVILICENGNNSMAVIENFEKLYDFKNLFNLKDGIQSWLKNNY
ncbi:MAG: molybdopterin-synthase adenylyltransferase MoeB [Bacteroidales bacterium]|nr:molybdopterin-synthase adenylyltransferase MoeB [Bacteroidales bacterium]MBN2755698.1 molybdopterin-synthase adenylyltransferase MoeB [Bacteroidales bacterium]